VAVSLHGPRATGTARRPFVNGLFALFFFFIARRMVCMCVLGFFPAVMPVMYFNFGAGVLVDAHGFL
jgi:hypothetical protein